MNRKKEANNQFSYTQTSNLHFTHTQFALELNAFLLINENNPFNYFDQLTEN